MKPDGLYPEVIRSSIERLGLNEVIMSEPIPSATVVLLREANETIEVLLLKSNSKIAYGGMWVYPGGKIDAADYEKAGGRANESGVTLTAAQNADHGET